MHAYYGTFVLDWEDGIERWAFSSEQWLDQKMKTLFGISGLSAAFLRIAQHLSGVVRDGSCKVTRTGIEPVTY